MSNFSKKAIRNIEKTEETVKETDNHTNNSNLSLMSHHNDITAKRINNVNNLQNNENSNIPLNIPKKVLFHTISYYNRQNSESNNTNHKSIVKIDNNKLISNSFLEDEIQYNFFDDPLKFFENSSLFIFHIKSCFRRAIVNIVNNIYFKSLMIFLTILSSIITTMDSPFNDPNSTYDKTLNILDYVFTWVFFTEMILKIVAFGVFSDNLKVIEIFDPDKGERRTLYVEKDFYLLHKDYTVSKDGNIEKYTKKSKTKLKKVVKEYGLTGLVYDFIELKNEDKEENLDIFTLETAYFKDFWNLIDCFIVISSLFYFFQILLNGNSNHSLKSLMVFRCFRSIRPLRMITRMKELKSLVTVLFLTVPAMGNLLIISLCFFLVFGILGVNFYKGLLGNCSDPLYKNSTTCIQNNGVWTPLDNNFDNIMSTFLILFQLSLSNGWIEIMFSTVDSSNNWSTVYFIVFLIIGNIFLINLSISIIVSNFFNLKEHEEGFKNLTKDQKDWIKIIRYFLKLKPKFSITNNFSKARRNFIKIINKSHILGILSHFFILGNIIIMAFRTNTSGETYERTYDIFFYISTVYFNFEILIKYFIKRQYFLLCSWQRFDMYLLILTDILIILKSIFMILEIPYFAIIVCLNMIRILRIFHLLRLFSELKDYLDSVLIIIPSLFHISLLIILILTIYSSLGINLFATIKYGVYINENVNFRNFSNSFLALIRCLTGEEWNLIMLELKNSQPGCKNDQTFEELIQEPLGCGTSFSYPYFISFMLLSYLIILNLFVAVVVDTFIAVTDKEVLVDKKFADEFFELWGKYDVDAKFLIEPSEFTLLLKELSWPLGLKKPKMEKNNKAYSINSIYVSHDCKYVTDNRESIKILRKVDIYARQGMVHILDAIKLVTKRYIIKTRNLTEDSVIIRNEKITNYLQSKFFTYDYNYKQLITVKKPYTAAHIMAVNILEKLIKNWKNIKKNMKPKNDICGNFMADNILSHVKELKEKQTTLVKIENK